MFGCSFDAVVVLVQLLGWTSPGEGGGGVSYLYWPLAICRSIADLQD